MPSTKKPETSPAAGRASESSDPAVHHLLAQRQTAAMNEDQEQLAAVDAQLVTLGFTEYRH